MLLNVYLLVLWVNFLFWYFGCEGKGLCRITTLVLRVSDSTYMLFLANRKPAVTILKLLQFHHDPEAQIFFVNFRCVVVAYMGSDLLHIVFG